MIAAAATIATRNNGSGHSRFHFRASLLAGMPVTIQEITPAANERLWFFTGKVEG
jgi:hypothetical protein